MKNYFIRYPLMFVPHFLACIFHLFSPFSVCLYIGMNSHISLVLASATIAHQLDLEYFDLRIRTQ